MHFYSKIINLTNKRNSTTGKSNLKFCRNIVQVGVRNLKEQVKIVSFRIIYREYLGNRTKYRKKSLIQNCITFDILQYSGKEFFSQVIKIIFFRGDSFTLGIVLLSIQNIVTLLASLELHFSFKYVLHYVLNLFTRAVYITKDLKFTVFLSHVPTKILKAR